MTTQRTGLVTLAGNPITLLGQPLEVGSQMPSFTVRRDLGPDTVYNEQTDAGKLRIINVVPSLETSVCSLQTARFNQEAAKLGDKALVITVSMDLPPAQERWCQANSVANLITASDYYEHSFGLATGLRIQETGLLARCVIILDGQGTVRYVQLVPEIGQEPDYDEAMAAVQQALN